MEPCNSTPIDQKSIGVHFAFSIPKNKRGNFMESGGWIFPGAFSNHIHDISRRDIENLLKLAVNIANSDNNYRTLVLKKPKHTKEIVATQDVASEEFIFAPQETFAAIKSSHKK